MSTTDAPVATFGERMKQARVTKGLSTQEATFAIRSRLPEPLWISNDPIRRMENGRTVEEKADPLLVCALAAAYGVRVRELSPLVADALGMVDDLLHATSEQENGLSICYTDAYQAVSAWREYDEPLPFDHAKAA